MRKLICLVLVLLLCVCLAAPVFAAEDSFVPSITYKPNPEVVEIPGEDDEPYIGLIRDDQGEIIDYVGHGCLRITPIAHVWDEEIEVPQVIEDLLLMVYEGLVDGSMTIPYEKHEADLDAANMVIRDLFDARWVCDEHREMVEKEGYTFEITFDLGVVADAEIFVMTYDEATKEWSPIVKTVNNGDGTVTCNFEHLCAIEFSMLSAGSKPVASAPAAAAGQGPNVLPWIVVLALAVVGVVVLVIAKKKKKVTA